MSINIPRLIVLHHSASSDGPGNNTAAIRAYHLGLGWKTIGYHACIELVGETYEAIIGRSWNETGAHCLGHNSDSLGLCFVGNFETGEMPEGQLIVGARVIRLWQAIYGIRADQIFLHGALNVTDCPGRNFPYARLREMLA